MLQFGLSQTGVTGLRWARATGTTTTIVVLVCFTFHNNCALLPNRVHTIFETHRVQLNHSDVMVKDLTCMSPL